MAGNKPTMTAWHTATPTNNAPLVAADTDADLFAVLRRLADKYTAKATYLGQLALVTTNPARVAGIAREAVRFARATESIEAIILQ